MSDLMVNECEMELDLILCWKLSLILPSQDSLINWK
jgi:hypothetical protein